MADKPTAAMVLSLIGGICILLGGAFIAIIGGAVLGLGVPESVGVGGVITVVGAVGAIMGLVIIVGAVMMYSNPQSHTMWGTVILVLSILSWVTALAGFVIGFLLALIGGILALVYKPSMAQASMGSPMMGSGAMTSTGSPSSSSGTMIRCSSCGAMAPAGSTKCPNCGASL